MVRHDWVFKLTPKQRSKLARKTISCVKKLKVTPAEYRKIEKTDPKKAAALLRKLKACVFKKK